MAVDEKPEKGDDKVTVVMRAHAWGEKAGQVRRVSAEDADFLVSQKHADLPKSKR